MERRLAAILAADVVGFSRLMRADEEATLQRLTEMRREFLEPLIAKHRGRIVKLMGDGLLVEFTSVVDAVACASSWQETVRDFEAEAEEDQRILFRIGVNLGDVIVEGNDLYGDGVNVAARLEGLAKPGSVLISASAYEQVRDKLTGAFEDLGEQRLKNIDRPVHTYRIHCGPTVRGSARRSPVRRWPGGRRAIVAAVAIAAILAIGPLIWAIKPRAPELAPSPLQSLDDKPSIAVMPFDNLSDDAAEDYFSDGITEDIIDALGRYKSLAVMAYSAVVPYRDQTFRPSDVGRNLGVSYLLEGSVRRAGHLVRVSARLTDAKTGVLLWSERFDEEKDDIFSVQDAITQRIAGTLVTNLREVELRRVVAKPTGSLDAYDLVLKGRAQLALASRKSNRTARQLFEQAIQLDPNYATAYAWLARAHYLMATDGWTEFPGEALDTAEELATKALMIDPELVEAHRNLARVHSIKFQLDRAMTEIDQAVGLNPSDAEAYGDRGLILLWAGRPDEAANSLETAFRLDPNLRSDYIFAYGLALYTLRRHEEAIRVLERGAARYASYAFIPAVLVAAYGQIGRIDDAQRNARKVKQLLPFFDPAAFGERFQVKAHQDYLKEGLRKGGLL